MSTLRSPIRQTISRSGLVSHTSHCRVNHAIFYRINHTIFQSYATKQHTFTGATPFRPVEITEEDFTEEERRQMEERNKQIWSHSIHEMPHANKKKLTDQERQEVFEYNQRMRKLYKKEMKVLRSKNVDEAPFSVPSLLIRVNDMQRYAAKCLAKAHREWKPLNNFPAVLQPETLQESFQVQRALTQELGYQVTGWKIGASNKTNQDRLGLSEPFIGPIYNQFTFKSPANLNMDRLISFEPKVECEIGFIIGEDLNIKDRSVENRDAFTIQDILKHTKTIVPLIEVIGSRIESFELQKRTVFTRIADAGGQVCIIKGTPLPEAEFEKIKKDASILNNIFVKLFKDQKQVVTGESTSVHPEGPLGSAAWVANFLKSQGHFLRKGDIIASGTMFPPVPVKKNETFNAEFDLLGKITVNFKGTQFFRLK